MPTAPPPAGLAETAAIAEWAALLACAQPDVNPAALARLLARVNWPALLLLAENHGVTQLLAARTQTRSAQFPPATTAGAILPAECAAAELLPPEIREALAERRRAQLFYSLRMSAELFRLAQRFAAQQIAMLVIKGPALAAQAYGDASLRTYGDLDLLVRDADIAKATELMSGAGYQPQIPLCAIAANKIPGQYIFRQPEARLLVEIHNDRTMRYYPRPLPIDKIFARGVRAEIDGREIPAPSIEDHLVVICVHGAKHFWERLMWIADVAALIARHPELRWEQAEQSAKDAGAETMLHGGLLLARSLLAAPVPANVLTRAQGDGAARKMADQVSRWLPAAGENPPSLLRRAAYRVRMRGGGAEGAAYLLRLLFSPTEEDWDASGHAPRSFREVLKRPFRLAKKHSLAGKD
jgi:hypothetical protein